MQKRSAAIVLKESILVLERRQLEEEKLLREQFSVAYESFKPLNVLKRVINEIATPSEFKDNLVETVSGLVSGYVSRKLLVRSSTNPVLRFAGLALQYGVTNFVTKNAETLQAVSMHFINKLTDKFRNQ